MAVLGEQADAMSRDAMRRIACESWVKKTA
jgi:hypothetical protein